MRSEYFFIIMAEWRSKNTVEKNIHMGVYNIVCLYDFLQGEWLLERGIQ